MFIRSTLEKILPVRKDEARLSPAARKYVMRGVYLVHGNVVRAATTANHSRETGESYPYHHTVTRDLSGVKVTSGERSSFEEPKYDAVDELNQPEALRRVNRVQNVARGLKGLLVAAITAGTVLAAVESVQAADAARAASLSRITACADVISGSETLTPLTVSPERAQQLGEEVCKIGVHEYAFNPVPNGQ